MQREPPDEPACSLFRLSCTAYPSCLDIVRTSFSQSFFGFRSQSLRTCYHSLRLHRFLSYAAWVRKSMIVTSSAR